MALNDLPQIDDSSENDDLAKSYFTSLLNQKAGYISREQTPDKGCDYMVELIESKRATNKHFGVQLKSIQKPEFIQKDSLISYTWETSRLHYLLRSEPIYGLLVIYDVSTEQAYYEFIDKVYIKLLERDNDQWTKKDSVKVHVPVTNILDKDSLKYIHEVFTQRHNNLSRMNGEQAGNYGLPVTKTKVTSMYNLDNVKDVIEILNRWGLSSILPNDLPLLYDLICKVPNNEIIQHKDVCILAALTNNEAGKLAESAYFLERLKKRFELNPSETHMVSFIRLKNELALGTLGVSDFILACKNLLEETDQHDNIITLRLNILFFGLSEIKAFQKVPKELADEVIDLGEIIDQLEDNVNKYYLKLWNMENLALLTNHVRTEGFNEMTIRKTFGRPMTLNERLELTNKVYGMQSHLYKELNTINEFAKEQNNVILQAFTFHTQLRYDLSFEIDTITFNNDQTVAADRHESLTNSIRCAATAFLVFAKNNLLSQAYNLLSLQYELSLIATDWYNIEIPIPIEDTKKQLSELEVELEYIPYQSSAAYLIARKKNKSDIIAGMKGILKLDKEQLENLAEATLRSGRFPNGKKEFIMHELLSFKMFFQRCNNPDIEPIVIKPTNLEYAYTFAMQFELKNKRTGIVSLKNTNMDTLLKTWGL
ncbi:DUF4365 domain-containing protein [Pedobacter hiemivivus]|uniref:DUF4365 domain-containing protein n=1 Tax=Pedobacter hiemivivus TaxID=2530454 RepID=A0A4U1GJG5_9SPHI|nr:DUF4365 domain-containing protein [Pedobacter hiemivivus]TKC64054.1 DUF4365 domain-containing protein [Pedobacter hiemivivus]